MKKLITIASLALALLISTPALADVDFVSAGSGGKTIVAADSQGAPVAQSAPSAPSRLSISLYAQVATLHLDGSFGFAPAGCIAYHLSDVVNPVACASIEASLAPSGQIAGRLGPQVGLVLPGLESTLGLRVPPCVVFGWGLLRIGPGDVFDHSKGAFSVAASVPFLSL
jgi:hypothetical protein